MSRFLTVLIAALCLTACVSEPTNDVPNPVSDSRLMNLKEGLVHALANSTEPEMRKLAPEVSIARVERTKTGALIGRWQFEHERMTVTLYSPPEDSFVSWDFYYELKDDGKAWVFSKLRVRELRGNHVIHGG